MENVTYPNSGALNRAHFALVTKQEQAFSGLDADRATRDTFESIKSRMKGKRGSPGTNVAGVTNVMESSISGLLAAGARSWGLRIPTIAPGWDSRQAREDLLLLLYCQTSINESDQGLSAKELQFAFTTALTLMEAGKTIEERRAGYMFCSHNLIRGHDMQLLMINTIRKDLESSFTARIELALDSIIATPSVELIPAVAPRLEELLSHHFPHVRRRAIHAFRLLSPHDPDVLQRCIQTLLLRLQDENASVKCAAIGLLEVCVQHGSIDGKNAIQALLGILQQLKQRKMNGLKVNQLSSIGIRALEALSRLIPKTQIDMETSTVSVLQIASKAANRGQWALLLASFQTLSSIPSIDVLRSLHQRTTSNEGSSEHPLLFLRSLLQSPDPNIVILLLRCLNLLPALAWAGGSTNEEFEPVISQGQGTGSNASMGSEPSPASQIDAADLFGEGVKADEPAVLPVTNNKTFPSIFTESDVGIIISYLKSQDVSIRKLTVQILSRADPSPTGLVHQYRQEIITKLSSMPPSFSPGLDHDLRNELVCRALEIADAIAHDGKTYCKSVVEILLQTERESVRATPTLSPTLSSKSGASNSTKKSSKGRGRGGVVESAIEMILTRVRSDSEFLSSFTDSLIPTMEQLKGKDQESISLLVITAAVVCEQRAPNQNVSQRAFDLFTSYLSVTSASIQETLLLSMLLLVGRAELNTEGAVLEVRQLAQQGSRHIHTRCLQFLDLIADQPKLRNYVSSIKDPNITSLLSLLETTSISTVSDNHNKPTSNSPSSSKQPLPYMAPVRRELRYTAYDTPDEKLKQTNRSSPQARNLHTTLLKGKHARVQSRTSHLDSPDLVLLSSSLFEDSRGDSTRPPELEEDRDIIVRNRDTKNNLLEVDSPFEVNPASSFSEIGLPPFLPRNISPPVGSPVQSPKAILRSPPLSPRLLTPSKGSPRSQLSQLRPSTDQQGKEVQFDVNWDRLGAQSGTTNRGWFEGDIDSALTHLRSISGTFEVTIVAQGGTEIKIEIKDTAKNGFMKLRQEEDQSTLWVFRSADSGLRRSIRSGLD